MHLVIEFTIGETNRTAPLNSYFLMADSAGNTSFAEDFGENWYDFGMDIFLAADSTVMIAGNSNSRTDAHNIFLRKTDVDHQKIYQKSFSGENSDWLNCAIEDMNENILLAGL